MAFVRKAPYSRPQVSWDIRSYILYRGAEELMPGAYSTDLRERVLVAVEAGEPADAVAERFMVGRSSVYRWMAAARDEGRRAPKPMGRRPETDRSATRPRWRCGACWRRTTT